MDHYIPTPQVLAFANLMHGIPIDHSEKSDGIIVVVFQDGRKMSFKRNPKPIDETHPRPLSGGTGASGKAKKGG
jgi:hypothetical protein